jgi:hypothetical protein
VSHAGWSERYPKWDLSQEEQRQAAVQNLTTFHDVLRRHAPESLEEGRRWHEEAHLGASAAIRGSRKIRSTSRRSAHEAASGTLAILSPAMDWKAGNVPALHAALQLRPEHWKTIERAHKAGGGRSAEVTAITKGSPLDQATTSALYKTHQILHGGAHPLDVISAQTSPKEWHFYHDLEFPTESHGEGATIDYRAHDVAINRMYPPRYGRGLEAGFTKTGRTATRYQHFARAYQTASEAKDFEHPKHFQAATWLGGKYVETLPPKKGGGQRKVGVPRRSQPYFLSPGEEGYERWGHAG